LERPLVHYLIAIAYASDTKPEEQTIDRGDWIGSATLIGPINKDAYELPESDGPEIRGDEIETRWQMTAVYNTPLHRGKGIAKMLINGALEFAAKESGKGRESRTRIMIHPRNIVVKKLYERIGFLDAGKCTLAEAYVSNGDSSMLPLDGGASDPERYLNRLGTIMEKVNPPAL
jgi:GNAT superfamily N-acetyltransferase